MKNLVNYSNTEIVKTDELQLSLFDDFITFIDRGEKTTRTYITNLRQFAAYLMFRGINAPVRADIISYRDYLSKEHEAIMLDLNCSAGWRYKTDAAGNRTLITCKPNTIAQYLRSVCQFFKWTASEGLYPNIAENIHAPKVRHDTHRKEALSAADVLAIEKSISLQAKQHAENAAGANKDAAGRLERATEQDKRLYAMYLLAVNAGLRTIELSRANVKDLELKNGVAYLYVYGKGHTEADTKKTLAPAVYDAVIDYLNSRADKYTQNSPLFVSTGNRSKGQRIATTTISTMLKRAMQQAGYDSDRITAHSLRHTAGTNVQELTNNIYLTQQYMRHSNPATTEIYLHNDTEKQEAEIAQRLYNYYHNIEGDGTTTNRLSNILAGMSAAQLEQLTNIAAAMAN